MTKRAAAAVVVPLLALTLAGCSGPPAPRFDALTEQAGEGGSFPDWVPEGGYSFDPLRRLAETDVGAATATVWAGQDTNEQWCVVALVHPDADGRGWQVGTECAEDDDFVTEGVRWGVHAPERDIAFQVLLVPDNADFEPDPVWDFLGENVAINSGWVPQ